jgi:hypothetical protein
MLAWARREALLFSKAPIDKVDENIKSRTVAYKAIVVAKNRENEEFEKKDKAQFFSSVDELKEIISKAKIKKFVVLEDLPKDIEELLKSENIKIVVPDQQDN